MIHSLQYHVETEASLYILLLKSMDLPQHSEQQICCGFMLAAQSISVIQSHLEQQVGHGQTVKCHLLL